MHRASGTLNTTLPSLAMVVILSLLILMAQREAVRPSLSKTIHAHHHTKTRHSQKRTHSLPSRLEHTPKTVLKQTLPLSLFVISRCYHACQLLCKLHCDSNHTLTLPRLAHEGKHVYALLEPWCVLWLVWEFNQLSACLKGVCLKWWFSALLRNRAVNFKWLP